MAFLNLQTQQDQPSLKKSIVSSSVFRSSTPIASVSKIPFGSVAKAIGSQPKPLQVDKIDSPDEPSALYGIVDALRVDIQSLRQEQTEASEIIGDIGNALATDFANRITEEKAQNTRLNKQRSKLRQQQEEKSIEKSLVKSQPNVKGDKKLGKSAFGGGILGKIFKFLLIIVSGMGITTTIQWMKDNGKSLKDVFDGIGKHWKWIAGGLGALIAIDVAFKIAAVVSALAGVVALLSNPLIWLGIGLIIAATSTGVGNRQKEVLSELDAMGGPTKENRMLMIARLRDQLNPNSDNYVSPINRVGREEIKNKIGFLESGDYGSKDAFGKQHSINWDILEESGNISKSTESRRVGGSITKGRLYRVHKDEIIKAPFTGTVERVGRAKQLISEGGGRITYINLPTEVIEGKLPDIKTSTPVATGTPVIDSVNPLNTYMIKTPNHLGISV